MASRSVARLWTPHGLEVYPRLVLAGDGWRTVGAAWGGGWGGWCGVRRGWGLERGWVLVSGGLESGQPAGAGGRRSQPMEPYRELAVFSGNAHRGLAEAVCKHLEMPLGECEVFEFSNEEVFVRFMDNIRERDVFLIQPVVSPVNTRSSIRKL